ncbi:hypothetical protein GCM10009636_29870 [Arthrobacter koreensis]
MGETPLAYRSRYLRQHSTDFHHVGELGTNNVYRSVCDKLTSMSTPQSNPAGDSARHSFPGTSEEETHTHSDSPVSDHVRDIAEVPAVEVITTAAVHLMSAAAVKCGLAEGADAEELKDLDEARKLITALAGFVTAAAPEIGSQHAGPLRDGLRSLQLAFREASSVPDAPGKGPGEKFTGPVN